MKESSDNRIAVWQHEETGRFPPFLRTVLMCYLTYPGTVFKQKKLCQVDIAYNGSFYYQKKQNGMMLSTEDAYRFDASTRGHIRGK